MDNHFISIRHQLNDVAKAINDPKATLDSDSYSQSIPQLLISLTVTVYTGKEFAKLVKLKASSRFQVVFVPRSCYVLENAVELLFKSSGKFFYVFHFLMTSTNLSSKLLSVLSANSSASLIMMSLRASVPRALIKNKMNFLITHSPLKKCILVALKVSI